MSTLMEPKNKVIDSLAESYTHGTDSVVSVNKISEWPDPSGVFYIDDGDEWVIWKYGSVDTTGGQLESLTAAQENNESSGASGHTFPSGSIIINARSVDYLLQVIKVLNGANEWPDNQIIGDDLKAFFGSDSDFSLSYNSTDDQLEIYSESAGSMILTVQPDGTVDVQGNEVNNISVLEADIISSPSVIGLRMNWTDDTWEYIDSEGNALGWTPDFTQLSPWNQIRRVNLNSNGDVVAAWGEDDYQHAPTSNDVNVMVEIPPFWYDYNYFVSGGDTIVDFYLANYNTSGLKPHPHVNQGEQAETYISAYEASAYSDDGGTTWYLASRSGETPVHGNGDYTGLNGNTLSNLDIEEARAYAQNVGAGWQQYEIWGYAAHRLLSMIYLGSMDFQSQIGRGIVDKSSGTGFNGENTGFDSIDSQLSEANLGTATGTGTDGLTPIAVLWVENPYGNIWTFVDGYEAVDSEYRILNRDGAWSTIGPPSWGTGDYEVSTASPLTDDDGYVNDIEAEELLGILGIPAATAGSSSTYIPDYFWSHDSGENNILLSGGSWTYGDRAGLACLISNRDVTISNRTIGARLEFIG